MAEPNITVRKVYAADGPDEWYGVTAEFAWVGAPPTVPDEEKVRAEAYRAGRIFTWDDAEYRRAERERREFGRAVALAVMLSPEWTAFFAKRHVVSVDINGSDSTQRRVTIPGAGYWRADSAEIDIDERGGYVMWSERD